MAKYTLLKYEFIPYNGDLIDGEAPPTWNLTFRVVKFFGLFKKTVIKTVISGDVDRGRVESNWNKHIGKTYKSYLNT